ncbi:hypothetical protein CTI12_AA264370 [Artemisia annua]|uniref:Uncharacterized protein n=1 Tax=Artemisia annua TaxID=35608 RepID=A0A2U1MSS1_ARTAN|nr:hypothetical protein CTI12_AA264370 [Artemisia annua]
MPPSLFLHSLECSWQDSVISLPVVRKLNMLGTNTRGHKIPCGCCHAKLGLPMCGFLYSIKCSATKKDKEMKFTLEFSWDTVKGKVADSIIAIQNGTKIKSKVMEAGQTANKPSTLYAIPHGLKFRLIQASFHWHKNEVRTLY